MKLVGRQHRRSLIGVLAAMIMASLSGSAVADTAAVAALLVPMMRSADCRSTGRRGHCLWPRIAPIVPFHSVCCLQHYQRIIHQ
ncbi:TRAP transporter large permease subunit [Escherichia coli]